MFVIGHAPIINKKMSKHKERFAGNLNLATLLPLDDVVVLLVYP